MSPDDIAIASRLAFAACLMVSFGGFALVHSAEDRPGVLVGALLALAGAAGCVAALVAGG